MVQRRGKAAFGFATNKTIRKFDITYARQYNTLDFDQQRLFEAKALREEEKQVVEDIKQTRMMERKRKLKNQPSFENIETIREDEADQEIAKLEKMITRKYIQGIATDEDGKQKVMFKFKGNTKIKNKPSEKERRALSKENK